MFWSKKPPDGNMVAAGERKAFQARITEYYLMKTLIRAFCK
jgi:hypothetical protein